MQRNAKDANEMTTEPLSTNTADIIQAEKFLQSGELVVVPTETVYGLAAIADNNSAVRQIFAAKGRPQDNPLIVHVYDNRSLSTYVENLSSVEEFLFEHFAPGPLTLVCNRKKGRASEAAVYLPSIALRIPAGKIIRQLLSRLGSGLAAPSANRSGFPSPTDFAMAWQSMQGRVAAIVDGGQCEFGLESTVLRCTQSSVQILRPGCITAKAVSLALQSAGFSHRVVLSSPPNLVDQDGGGKTQASPGTRYRHYAPQTPMYLYQNMKEIKALFKHKELNNQNPHSIWVIIPESMSARHRSIIQEFEQETSFCIHQIQITSLKDYAHRLYRLFDYVDRENTQGIGSIFAYLPTRDHALRDRLLRASQYH